MGPITIATGISAADQILKYFGIDPLKIGEKILSHGGDKRRRLDQIEMLGNATAMHLANTLKAIESLPAEQASAVKDGLLMTAAQTIAMMVKSADLDGSSA